MESVSREFYCVIKKGKFVEPLQFMTVKGLDPEGLAETLQMLYYKRTGNINPVIGLDYDKDVELAKEMGVLEKLIY